MTQVNESSTRTPDTYENPISSRADILSALRSLNGGTLVTLANFLKLKKQDEKKALSFRTRAMIRDNQVIEIDKKLYDSNDLSCEGTVVATQGEHGFLNIQGGKSWFLSPSEMKKTMHGERVQARPIQIDQRGISGAVVKRISAPFGLIGKLVLLSDALAVETNIAGSVVHFPIAPFNQYSVKEGDLVKFDVLVNDAKKTRSALINLVLNPNKDAKLAHYRALASQQIPSSYTDELIELSQNAVEDTLWRSKDMLDATRLPLVTVDAEWSQDLDDAIYCEEIGRSGYRVVVAIANVSSFVLPGSTLDSAALEKGTSHYTPLYASPMLNELLANNACSLNPNEEKLVMMCDMSFDENGVLTDYDFYEARAKSHKRLSYSGLQEAFDTNSFDHVSDEVEQSLKAMYKLYTILRQNRDERIMFDFEQSERAFSFDESGGIMGIESYQQYHTHKMVEELMVQANVSAARYICDNDHNGLFRHHGTPNEEKTQSINEWLIDSGVSSQLDMRFSKSSVSTVLQDLSATGLSDEFSLRIKKAMPPAFYCSQNSYHFGLNLTHYAHFTSPIRRYTDIIIHRIIKAINNPQARDAKQYTLSELANIADISNDNARKAMLVERSANEYLSTQYVATLFKKNKTRVYSATFTGSNRHANFYTLFDGMVYCELATPSPQDSDTIQGDDVKVMIDNIDVDSCKITVKLVI